jgi:SAM-dependent methyltransferase
VATDVDIQRLSHLRVPVEVRRHDIARDDLESAAYDLVHCRLVLEHLTEPVVALQKMATAVAPGGWLVVEEADFGLVEFAGAAESPPGSIVLREVFTRWAAAGVIDSYLCRRLPGLVGALGAEAFGVDAVTQIGGPGDPAYETFRLAWPDTRAGAAAVGLTEDDLRCVDRAFAFHCPRRRHHFRRMGPATTPTQRQT